MQQLDDERGDEAQRDDDDAPYDARTPAQPQAQVPLAIGHESTPVVDDENPFLRDHGDDRRGRDLADPSMASPDFEQRRIVRIDIRKNPLHRAAPPAREREADAVGEPVAHDGARRVEPPALAQCNRHHGPVPRTPLMRNFPCDDHRATGGKPHG
jgi:hypothetical protein